MPNSDSLLHPSFDLVLCKNTFWETAKHHGYIKVAFSFLRILLWSSLQKLTEMISCLLPTTRFTASRNSISHPLYSLPNKTRISKPQKKKKWRCSRFKWLFLCNLQEMQQSCVICQLGSSIHHSVINI